MTTEAQTTPDESSSTDMDKVIARIQKLLNRVELTKDQASQRGSDAGSEAEAERALEQAQALALKHNLDLAQIEAAGATKNNLASVERVKEEAKGRAMYKWQRTLARHVAEANFCYHLIQERKQYCEAYYRLDSDETKAAGKTHRDFKSVKLTSEEYWDTEYDVRRFYKQVDARYQTTHKHIFVGRKGNVITAQLMFQYLTQTIEDLVLDALGLENKDRLSRSAMSWKEGCADRLCARLATKRQDLIEKHDARARAEEVDRQAERERQTAEHKAKQARQLGANHATEVQHAFDGIKKGAHDRTGPVADGEEPDRPDEDEAWTPEGDAAPEVAEQETGTALVLASEFSEQELDANRELALGYEPGTFAKWRKEREEERRKAAEEEATEEQDKADAPVKQETERQRAARLKREREEDLKARRRWARMDAAAERQAQRDFDRRDHRAYRMGAKKGADIGIDVQVAAGTEPKKLG
jgi:hypothetical protein